MTRLCIFDLDGTLVNSLRDLACAMNHALSVNGFETHETEKYRFMVGSGILVLIDRAVGNDTRYTPEIRTQIHSDFNKYYAEHCLDYTVPYSGITEMLKIMADNGILLAVNSNKPDEFSKHIVSSLFPSLSFAEIWGKREGCERKPAPDGIFGIIKKTGISKSETVYFGDSDIDVFTAKNAGIRFCGVGWGFRPVNELINAGAQTIADSPGDILRFICS